MEVFQTQPSLSQHWQGVLSVLDYALQPIVNTYSGDCHGYEALLRGHASTGFASIGEIFDRAHGEGCLQQLDLQLRAKALDRFAPLSGEGRRLFFNLDHRIFESSGHVSGNTLALLQQRGLGPDSLCVELSERRSPDPIVALPRVLHHYRKQGLKVAIDNYGVGVSSMQRLYLAEPDFIKVDRFFIQGLDQHPRKRVFLANIIDLAHLLGNVVIAEGVETEAEYYLCRELGCDLLQGYLIQAPERDSARLATRYPEIARLNRADRRRRQGRDQALIRSHIERIEALPASQNLSAVLEEFQRRRYPPFLPVVDGAGAPVGVIRELDLKDYTYSQYGRDLLQNRHLRKDLRSFVRSFPLAELHLSAEKVLEIYSKNAQTEGILITEKLRYFGFLSAASLLKILNEKNLGLAREQNPLSRLPGNTLLFEYLSTVLGDMDSDYLLVYFDFDDFKPFNDKYGFRNGDRVIMLFADLLRAETANSGHFAAHIGGDDFFLGVQAAPSEDLNQKVLALLARFREDVVAFYEPQDQDRGYILSQDRRGETRRFGLLRASAALLWLPAGRTRTLTPEAVSQHLGRLKSLAKASPQRLWVERLDEPGPVTDRGLSKS